MRRWICVCFAIAFFAPAQAQGQVRLPRHPDSLFSTYYHQRVSHFHSLPQTRGDVIFLGNSITDGGEWNELFTDLHIKNWGISGDVSAGVLNRMDEVVERKPAKVFLLIGTNDLARNVPADSLVKNITAIASYLKQESPATQLFVQSILPVNDAFGKFSGHTGNAAKIKTANEKLKQEAANLQYTFIDLHDAFADENGKLKKELTNDGLHLTGRGYVLWKHLVYGHVYGLQQKASLLPLPQKMQWNTGVFPLYECGSIFIGNAALQSEAAVLQRGLEKKGLSVSVEKASNQKLKAIRLQLGKVASPLYPDEAYRLTATEAAVTLTANTPHGIFNGIQTLLQLAADGVMIDACDITDWPAFSWRGYMIDAGRNYVSMDLLKEQIDVMARYKLNVFHFHPTEDIAWRIGSKLYPQLTAPENMLRNKGLYYTETETKELIGYCKERHITFVPEIDMPGHSAAFRRAMNTDMQSDSGLFIVKKLLQEFCTTYPEVQYIHIGADEVNITNQRFIPEVTALLQSKDKKVIGWQPGGNFNEATIRQLWMEDNGKITGNNNIQYIDSRHLYINHMDPLESVVTIFNRQIGNKEKGDAVALGGTLCLWHDRAAATENDLLRMNPVYSSMLAFSERIWRGGGQRGWIANVSDGNEKDFAEFEARLLDQKKSYFGQKPFPYDKQSNLVWNLYGPFDNVGDVAKTFPPENTLEDLRPIKQVKGGTVVLRHWWAPLIKGAIDKPKDSTTWYAVTKLWSDEGGEKPFWIGFNNLSRSPATNSLPIGEWDDKGSKLWVNDNSVAPPRWKRGGQKGNPEIPLVDEGYEYREPTKIVLRKGWNTVLIKAPVGSFKAKDWQNPVKWMFTFLPIETDYQK